MEKDPYRPLIQQIVTPDTLERGVSLYLSREDRNDPLIQGNKFHKLKLNLAAAREQGLSTLLTFGGAYSNHIYATAMAGKRFGFETVGIIRGEKHPVLNPTLQAAANAGMTLYYIDRERYRNKYSEEVLRNLTHEFGDFYLLPEGGTNKLAVQGCRDMVKRLPLHFDFITLPAGTGGSAAGVISGLSIAPTVSTHVIAFSALKGDFLKNDIADLLQDEVIAPNVSWELETNYHFGGYAKITPQLATFIKEFRLTHDVVLEPVYTGKMLFGLIDMIRKGRFEKDTRIMAIHTGGLQGLEGMREQYGDVF
ncbi:1-aminocyclopropane-1-carboxylate deaminase/D-cysteine desulfhydrase [Roseivirga sp. BDSF3-8]|uniref:1-aminocyclopropane-1-carboxylate deaminase/D-cysteine desulfhydrase n=1 Tax=Roseivirga sp. BDSF3-8 TaxID=3241598 RepID=UPI003531EFD0